MQFLGLLRTGMCEVAVRVSRRAWGYRFLDGSSGRESGGKVQRKYKISMFNFNSDFTSTSKIA
jgi:hypothetical protein